MHRLFVAIPLPAPIRARLADLMEGVGGARWQDEDQLHITLRFIGEVERPVAEDVAGALLGVRHPRFELALAGLGTFERRGKPSTLWAGLAPRQPLVELHHKVDTACCRSGLERDRRAYAPHVTLARLEPGAGPLAAILSAPLSSEPFAVNNFGLYESELTPSGAVHSLVQLYSLA
jgi:2'-5' RNA ligase